MHSVEEKRNLYRNNASWFGEFIHLSVNDLLKPVEIKSVNQNNVLCWKVNGKQPKVFDGGLFVNCDISIVTCRECLELIHA